MAEKKTEKHINMQELKGCVPYHGTAKTVREMDEGIALRAAQDFFAQLAPADVLFSEELIRERREEGKREES